MHPLVLPPAARHRREVSTRQRLRLAVAILFAFAAVATVGVFGGSVAGGVTTQLKVLDWLALHGISLALAGWTLYALPLAGVAGMISVRGGRVLKLFAGMAFVPALGGAAIMSRPRRTSVAQWQAALGPTAADFVQAAQLTTYILFAAVVVWAVGSAIAFLMAKPAPVDEILLRLRRSATVAALSALAASLAVTTFV